MFKLISMLRLHLPKAVREMRAIHKKFRSNQRKFISVMEVHHNCSLTVCAHREYLEEMTERLYFYLHTFRIRDLVQLVRN